MESNASLRKGELALYAIIPAADGPALAPSRSSLALVTFGPFAAIAGPPKREGDLAQRALAHERVVRGALLRCSSVIPFRHGTELPSRDAIVRLLERNRVALRSMLDRFSGRVEMGIKIRLPEQTGDLVRALFLPQTVSMALANVRALVAAPDDLSERIHPEPGRATFEGAYLIDRDRLSAFWRAADVVRLREPSFPVLDSGPWAAYSFCAPLRGGGQ